jgi:hypothetical protein
VKETIEMITNDTQFQNHKKLGEGGMGGLQSRGSRNSNVWLPSNSCRLRLQPDEMERFKIEAVPLLPQPSPMIYQIETEGELFIVMNTLRPELRQLVKTLGFIPAHDTAYAIQIAEGLRRA